MEFALDYTALGISRAEMGNMLFWDFEAVKVEFKPEVREKLLWRNGQKLLEHTSVGQMSFIS